MHYGKPDLANRCSRCSGLLVREYLIDYTNGDRAESWSCFLCGNKVDATILVNRALLKLLITS